jgi:hypothetical protein
MEEVPKRYKLIGRIAFHSNGGFTQIQFWAGGPQLREVETASISASLREIGTWVMVQFSPFEVTGPGEPQDWPWDDPIPRGPRKDNC